MPVAEAARRAGCGAGVVRGLIAAGHAEERLLPGEPPAPPPRRLGRAGADAVARPAARRRPAGRAHRRRRLQRHGARRGHRFGQDRDLFRRDRGGARRRPSGAGPACPRSRSGRNGSTASAAASARCRSNGIPTCRRPARRDAWRAVAAGRRRIVVGARSALFLPFAELGLIVVDEEHDPSYKQEDGVCYQARDMAVLRASLAQIPIVLVSATPSLETVVNVARGRYQRVSLPRRHAEAALPEIALDRHAARAARARAVSVGAAGRGARPHPGRRRAGAAVPQPARLCAA